MNNIIAQQIADLLNSENQLVVEYSSTKVLDSSNNYVYEETNDSVKAFVECKKVQWYQFEVCHLTVSPKYRGKGLGEIVIKKALAHAKKDGGRIVQCTIREDNEQSKGLFTKCGFIKTSVFFYPNSGNNVGVWQKIISKGA